MPRLVQLPNNEQQQVLAAFLASLSEQQRASLPHIPQEHITAAAEKFYLSRVLGQQAQQQAAASQVQQQRALAAQQAQQQHALAAQQAAAQQTAAAQPAQYDPSAAQRQLYAVLSTLPAHVQQAVMALPEAQRIPALVQLQQQMGGGGMH